MNKILIVVAAIFIWNACNPSISQDSIPEISTIAKYKWYNDVVYIIKIRDCEYVVGGGFRENSVTHAGDCHNPIHQKN